MKNITIETDRLRIRTATEAEMRRLMDTAGDEDLRAAYGEMLRLATAYPDKWAWYAAWVIELKSGEEAGDLCFKGLCEDGSVEIGYGILEANRGLGYAAEAVGAAVSWALSQPGVTRVEAETEPDNAASQRVLAKCGFTPNGKTGEEGPRFERKA